MSEKTKNELVIDLSTLFTKIQKRITAALSPHGISFTEYMVLRQLVAAPANKMRRIDLAENIGLSASGVTRLLNPMEKIGLVIKEENARDARVSLVAISEAGRRIFKEAESSFDHSAQTLFSPVTESDVATLSHLAKKLM